jgi:hypothetical protein
MNTIQILKHKINKQFGKALTTNFPKNYIKNRDKCYKFENDINKIIQILRDLCVSFESINILIFKKRYN